MSENQLTVRIGANITEFQRSIGQVQSTAQGVSKEFGKTFGNLNKAFTPIATSIKGVSDATLEMANKMKTAYDGQKEKMKSFQVEQMAIKSQFYDLADSAKNYGGTTKEFMSEVETMGKKHKAVTDNMLKNNDMMKTSFIQSVGAMLAKSGQSSKITENFDRMKNPLYQVNNGLLKISGGLENIAKRGTPAVLALKMLGPSANMKDLQNMTVMITQGLMRFQMVALAAVVGAGLFYSAIHKSAMKNEEYAESFNAMKDNVKKMFEPMIAVFAQIMPHVFNFISGVAQIVNKFNEAHPFIAKLVGGFLLLIPALIAILSPLAIGIGMFAGLQAAFASVWLLIGPLVAGLAAMSGTVLLVAGVIVALVAVGILLYKNWDTIVKWLGTAWDWLKEKAVSVWNGIKSVTVSVFDGIINFFKNWGVTILAVISGPIGWMALLIYKNWDAIKSKTSEIWNGVKTFLSNLWTGIVAVGKVVWEGYKTFVVNIFNAYKTIIMAVWNAVKSSLTTLWNGIISAGKFIWEAYKTYLTTVFNVYKTVIMTVWNAIKTFLVTIFTSIKTTAMTIFTAISSFISTTVGSMKTFIVTTFTSILSSATTIFNNVKDAIIKPLEKAKDILFGIIDAIKGAFARMVIKIPKPKIPKINVGSTTMFGGKGGIPAISIPTFDIDWFATGGIIKGSKGGQVVGVGENGGDEAIVPLSNKSRMKPFANEIGSVINKKEKGGNGLNSQAPAFTVQFNIEKMVANEQTAKQLANTVMSEMFRNYSLSYGVK